MARTRTSAGMSPCLERAEDLVNEHPVAHLDGDLGEKLVAAVHGVAGLEGGDRRPALIREERPGLGGPQVEPPVGLGEVAFGEDRDRPRQVDRPLGHDLGDARVGLVGRAVDLAAFEGLVDGVSLGNREDAQDLSPFVRPAPPPSPMAAAESASQESVMGNGQKSPFSRRMSSQAPRQSAAPMKPASGV